MQPIYRYCYRRLGSTEAAEDATSEVFAKVLAGLPKYREDCFRRWLFTIAHHVTVDALRSFQLQEPLDATPELADTTLMVEEVVVSAETQRALLALLPVDQRHVIELRLAGLTGEEIAGVLGRSVGAIKSIQFRALARLRNTLDYVAALTGRSVQ